MSEGVRSGRPTPVTSAAVLMVCTAAVAVANAIIAGFGVYLFNTAFLGRVAPMSIESGGVENTEWTVRVGLIAVAIVMLASAAVLAAITAGIWSGNPRARSTAWAFGALMTVLALVTVCSSVVSKSTLTFGGGDRRTETTSTLVRAAQSAVPGWFGVAIGSLSGLIVLGYIASSILLAVPSANTYFHYHLNRAPGKIK